MLSALRWLALEVKSLEAARSFYEEHLRLSPAAVEEGEVAYNVGDQELRLRRPSSVPRGGLHTHYAFSTPDDRYDTWWDRLDGPLDLIEHRFGEARSLYCYDPDGNCVEIGEAGGQGADLTGIFEVVLEVEDLPAAETFYGDLGFETVDRGAERHRVRMAGPVDLELWEPHLGIADARGGVHVDLGFAGDVQAAIDAVGDRALEITHLDGAVRLQDPDGHRLTVQ